MVFSRRSLGLHPGVELMNSYYEVAVTLEILGPFLTSAINPHNYGLDNSFYRNERNELTIPGSHIKGKLRSALEGISAHWDAVDEQEIEKLFGKPSGDDNGQYEPRAGILYCSDLVTQTTPQDNKRTRVTILGRTQTAAENLLRSVEDPFPSGSAILFDGTIRYPAKDEHEAIRISQVLQIAFLWLPSLGAETGVGFGRVKSVKVSNPQPRQTPLQSLPIEGNTSLHLAIMPQGPILIGDVKKRRSNYVESRFEISGAAIKGALAATLNETFGVTPVSHKIDPKNATAYKGYENLAEFFSDIRVTHAFPALSGGPRPVHKPISTVRDARGQEYDVALLDDVYPIFEEYAPAYFHDWKPGGSAALYQGIAQPQRFIVTRTAINDTTLRSDQGQLFTYVMLAPHTSTQEPVAWVCNIDFDAIGDDRARSQVMREFIQAVQRLPLGVGKNRRPVDITVHSGRAQAALLSKQPIENDLAIVTLQTDAIMLDPAKVRELPLSQDLYELYAEFWRQLSGGGLKLLDFFSHQGFEGGYLYHRKLGSVERETRPNHYRPYYLTKAGSVFKLRAEKEAKVHQLLVQWQTKGLPWPDWALTQYGGYEREYWQVCPFVPENGYGEIAVNLAWHWDKRPNNPSHESTQ
jgi:hypothetical protein